VGRVRRSAAADALAEAAIAWWHAYEGRRRLWYVAGLVTVFVFFVMVVGRNLTAATVVVASTGRTAR
jgi:hypothetical protein